MSTSDHRLPRTTSDLSKTAAGPSVNSPTSSQDSEAMVPARSSRRATVFAAKVFTGDPSSLVLDNNIAVDKKESMALGLSASGSLEPQKVLVLENICKELKRRAMMVGDNNRKMDLICRATMVLSSTPSISKTSSPKGSPMLPSLTPQQGAFRGLASAMINTNHILGRLASILRFYLFDWNLQVRVYALRALRYIMRPLSPGIVLAVVLKPLRVMELVCIRLEVSNDRCERTAAIKFIRRWISLALIDGQEIPVCAIRSMVAITDSLTTDVGLRSLCLSTLTTVLLKDPKTAIKNGALGSLFKYGCLDPVLSTLHMEPIVWTVVHVLQDGDLRDYSRKQIAVDLMQVFTVFTGYRGQEDSSSSGDAMHGGGRRRGPQTVGADEVHEIRCRCARRCICALLCTVPGLLLLSDNCEGLASLISLMKKPNDMTTVKELLILFQDVLGWWCVPQFEGSSAIYSNSSDLPNSVDASSSSSPTIDETQATIVHRGLFSWDHPRSRTRGVSGFTGRGRSWTAYKEEPKSVLVCRKEPPMDMTRVFGSLLLRILLTFGLSSAVSYLATMTDPENEPVAHQATSLIDTILRCVTILLPSASFPDIHHMTSIVTRAANFEPDKTSVQLRSRCLSILTWLDSDNYLTWTSYRSLGYPGVYWCLPTRVPELSDNDASMSCYEYGVNSVGCLSWPGLLRIVQQPQFIPNATAYPLGVIAGSSGDRIDWSNKDHVMKVLRDSKVLSTRDYSLWHWPTIHRVVAHGCIDHGGCHSVAFECILETDFLKKLLRFFSPIKHHNYRHHRRTRSSWSAFTARTIADLVELDNESATSSINEAPMANPVFGSQPWNGQSLALARLANTLLALTVSHPVAREKYLGLPESFLPPDTPTAEVILQRHHRHHHHTFTADLASMLNESITGAERHIQSDRKGSSWVDITGRRARTRGLSGLSEDTARSTSPVGDSSAANTFTNTSTKSAPEMIPEESGQQQQRTERVGSWGQPVEVNDHPPLQRADPIVQSGLKWAAKDAADSLTSSPGEDGIVEQFKRLSREYGAMIGVLSSTREGVALLQKYDMYRLIYRMVLISSLDPFTAALLSCLSLGVARRNRKAIEAALTNGSAYLQCFVVSLLTSLTHIDTTRSFESDATALTNSDVQYIVDPEEKSATSNSSDAYASYRTKRVRNPYDSSSWWDEDASNTVVAGGAPSAQTRPFRGGGFRFNKGHAVGMPSQPRRKAAPSFDARRPLIKGRAMTLDSGGEDAAANGSNSALPPSTVSRINPGEVDFLRWATRVLVQHLELDIAGCQAMAQTALASMGYVALYYNTDHVVLDEMVKYGGSLSDLDCPVRLCLLSNEEMCQKHIQDGWLDTEWQRWVDEEMKRYVDVLDLLWTERVKHAIVGFHGEALEDKTRADKLGISGSKSDEFPPPSESQRDPAFVLPNPSYLKPTVNYKYQSLQYPWLLRLPWYISVKFNNESFTVGGLVSRRISVKILKQLKAYSVLSHNILEAGPLAHLVVAAPVPLEVDEDAQKNSLQVALCIGSQYCSVYGGGLVSDPEWCSIPIGDMRRDALAIDGEEEAIFGKYHRWQCPKSGVIVTFILGDDGKIRVRSVGFPIRFEPSSSTPISIIPPLHICRPLASTSAGVNWLRRNKMPWLVEAREHLERCLAGDPEKSNAEAQSQCRVYMWMFANIGAGGELGVGLMEDIGALETLVKMATKCKHLCLRGSAIYALSLLCSVPSAHQALLNLGWDPVVHGPVEIEEFLGHVDKDEKPADEDMSSMEEYSDLSTSSTASSSDLSVREVDRSGLHGGASPLFCQPDSEDEDDARASPTRMRRAGSENMLGRYRHAYLDRGGVEDSEPSSSSSEGEDGEAASLKRLLAANPFSALTPSVYNPNGEDVDLSYAARKNAREAQRETSSSSSSSSSDSDLANMDRETPSEVGPLPVFTKKRTQRRRGTTAPRRAFYKEYTPEHAEILRHLTALCNTVAYKESHKFLIRKKHSEPHLFQSVGLWLRIHKRMLKLHFPLATRRVIDNLFDYVFLDFDALNYLDTLK